MYNATGLGGTRSETVFTEAAAAADETLVDGIKTRLISEISDLLAVNAHDLDVDEPLVNYGLSSMTGMMLSGNIEAWFGIQLDPSVAWEYPTIESLAGYLAREVKRQNPAFAGFEKVG